MRLSPSWVAALGLATGLLACSPGADRAQLPRHLVAPDTVLVGVLDLEVLTDEMVQVWSSTLDPQGQHAYTVDDLHWALQDLRAQGARKWVWLNAAPVTGSSNDPTPSTTALLQADPDADPTALLSALWDVSAVIGCHWPVASVALLEWQPGWWVIESPDFVVPAWQAEEHGAPWQSRLGKATHAPLRVAFQISPSQQKDWQSLGQNPWVQAWLGPLAQPLASLQGGALILDHQGSSPRIYAQAELGNREDARLAQELGRDGLKALHRFAADLLNTSFLWSPTAQDPGRAEAWRTALAHVFDEVRLRRSGHRLELTLDRHFFAALRHLRNLQTQEDPSAPAGWDNRSQARLTAQR